MADPKPLGTIAERPRKDGSIAYLVQIILRKHDFKDSRTFDTMKAAKAWQKKRSREIRAEIEAGQPLTSSREAAKRRGTTLADVIDSYVKESMKKIGKTKAQVLNTIKSYDLADKRCDQITSQDIVAFAQELHERPGLGSAATVQNYLSHLSAIFAIARPMWGIPLDAGAMKDAMTVCKRMGLTAKSKGRERRPTLAELDALLSRFESRSKHRPSALPMHTVAVFAIYSTRRQDEICRITWADYDRDGKRVMVRDMKHPGDKEGNDTWVELPDPCCAIIDAMPKTSDRIFPYSADAVSAAFTRACKALGIEDLHFHDLRHEGTSRLFEMGRTIPQAASVTGHRSWSSLQRYAHLRQTGDKYAGWSWIGRVC